jgi:hypothetical protein
VGLGAGFWVGTHWVSSSADHGLREELRTLKLSGMLKTLDARLAQARAGELGTWSSSRSSAASRRSDHGGGMRWSRPPGSIRSGRRRRGSEAGLVEVIRHGGWRRGGAEVPGEEITARSLEVVLGTDLLVGEQLGRYRRAVGSGLEDRPRTPRRD